MEYQKLLISYQYSHKNENWELTSHSLDVISIFDYK